jgi:hemerythrin-like domain-containing protein
MEELVREHVLARQTVGELVGAKERYLEGDTEALDTVLEKLDVLVSMYPGHIEKEDEHFFLPVMEYLSEAEQDDMLEEMWEFDRSMIHEKYRSVVDRLESRR